MKKSLKNIAASIITLTLISPMIFVSCDKEAPLITESVPQAQNISKAVARPPQSNDTIYWPNTHRYFYNNGKDCGCRNARHGCLDEDITIKPALFNTIKDIAKDIQSKPDSAPTIFRNNYKTLMEVFEKVFVSSVIDGKATLEICGGTEENKCIYFIFHSKFANEETCVVPVRE